MEVKQAFDGALFIGDGKHSDLVFLHEVQCVIGRSGEKDRSWVMGHDPSNGSLGIARGCGKNMAHIAVGKKPFKNPGLIHHKDGTKAFVIENVKGLAQGAVAFKQGQLISSDHQLGDLK